MSADPLADIKAVIRGLSKPQRAVFDRVCAGDDSCISKQMGERLTARGLVRLIKEDRGIVTVYRYAFATIPVHMAWAEVCSEEHERSRGRKP